MLTPLETESSSLALSVLSHTYIASLGCLWFCTAHISAVYPKTSGSANVLQAGARGKRFQEAACGLLLPVIL